MVPDQIGSSQPTSELCEQLPPDSTALTRHPPPHSHALAATHSADVCCCCLLRLCFRPRPLTTHAVVPPGYYIITSSGMTLCPQGTAATPPTSAGSPGTFREGWVMYSDPKATTCTSCGEGILSEPRDKNDNPMSTVALVQATSASCCKLRAPLSYCCV
jgi:hypothetical protein